MQKDFKALIGQGEQAQGGSWKLTKEEGIVCIWERKERGRGRVKNFLVLMCARIKHGKNVCRN